MPQAEVDFKYIDVQNTFLDPSPHPFQNFVGRADVASVLKREPLASHMLTGRNIKYPS